MSKIQKTSFLVLALSHGVITFGNEHSPDIIYGDDNRIETFQASERDQTIGAAVAGMIEAKKLLKIGAHAMLPPATLKNDIGVCANERFSEQPAAALCTGFLVAPNLIVTAGHCIPNEDRCSEVNFVFDYKVKENSGRADMLVPKEKVYSCKRVIEAKLTSGFLPLDYSLVELDRVVEGVKPLKIRTQGAVALNASIFVVGHPSGLPQKISGGAKVIKSAPILNHFVTNLDAYGGNSGSPVIDNDTGIVEGILVRGSEDYIRDGEESCVVSNKLPEDAVEMNIAGESVNRITTIKALVIRDELFEAIESGDLEKVESLIHSGADVNILNSSGKSPFEVAAINQSSKMLNLLVSNGAKIDLDTVK